MIPYCCHGNILLDAIFMKLMWNFGREYLFIEMPILIYYSRMLNNNKNSNVGKATSKRILTSHRWWLYCFFIRRNSFYDKILLQKKANKGKKEDVNEI